MIALTFDTHAFIKKLIAAGMPEAQAEAVSTLVRECREADLDQFPTKSDLQLLEQRITIRLGGMLVVTVGVLLAAIRYLPPGH